jgi:hypothetical protein
MDIIRAIRADLQLTENISVDCYQYPNGTKRIGITGASLAIGYNRTWLGKIINEKASVFCLLQKMGFTGIITKTQCLNTRGASVVFTLSQDDFDVLIRYAAIKGKPNAMAILSKTSPSDIKTIQTSKLSLEKQIQIALAKTLDDAKLEVLTPAGKIDILTKTQLIEVKEWKRWKEAIGQVLCYGHYYPNHQKQIHFFGNAHDEFIDMVKIHCERLNIQVV